jgi:hypothetical protein
MNESSVWRESHVSLLVSLSLVLRSTHGRQCRCSSSMRIAVKHTFSNPLTDKSDEISDYWSGVTTDCPIELLTLWDRPFTEGLKCYRYLGMVTNSEGGGRV